MPRIIQTNPDGSPIGNYLTQSARQRTVDPVRRTQLQTLPSGIRYAYSGPYGSGAEAGLSVTLLDIADSGSVDLMCTLEFSVDFNAMSSGSYAGWSLSINGSEVFFTKGNFGGAGGYSFPASPENYQFILPAHSSFTVLGICEDTGALRTASIIGRPV